MSLLTQAEVSDDLASAKTISFLFLVRCGWGLNAKGGKETHFIFG